MVVAQGRQLGELVAQVAVVLVLTARHPLLVPEQQTQVPVVVVEASMAPAVLAVLVLLFSNTLQQRHLQLVRA